MSTSSTVSGSLGGTVLGVSTVSSSGSVANAPSLEMHGGSSHSAIGSISSIGHTNKLGQASLSSGNPFTTGFSVGFKAGTRISAIGTVEQNNLDAVATMIANGVVEKGNNSLLSFTPTER